MYCHSFVCKTASQNVRKEQDLEAKPCSEILKSLEIWQPKSYNELLGAIGTWRDRSESCREVCHRQHSASRGERAWVPRKAPFYFGFLFV